MQTVKTNVPNMVLDTSTGAVLNKDIGGYEQIKRAREEKKRQFRLEERVAKLEQKVADLEAQLQNARDMGSIL